MEGNSFDGEGFKKIMGWGGTPHAFPPLWETMGGMGSWVAWVHGCHGSNSGMGGMSPNFGMGGRVAWVHKSFAWVKKLV